MPNPNAKRTDRRELPAYSIAEAAHYLTVPEGTVRYWSTGQGRYAPLIEISSLQFINLVELHVLAAIRRKHTVPMPKVRSAIEYLSKNTDSVRDKRHPLLSKQLETNGLDLFIQRYGELLNISQDGQIAMRDHERGIASH